MKLKAILPLIVLIAVIFGCQPSTEKPFFEHDIASGPTPWSSESFNIDNEQFSFAIITDLNGGERDGIFSVAVEQVNLLHPEFVLSVGDLIDGGTEDRDQLQKEWDSFDERASNLNAPFFHLGGNHDLTNVAMRDFWAERYGPRYYHFKYKNVLFLMMDSEDYSEERMHQIYTARAKAIAILDGPNPELYPQSEYYSMPERRTGEVGDEQNAYFEKVLANNPEVDWTFVLMHKPVWMREGGNNLDRLEGTLSKRPYTVINGHFHAYSHRKRNDRDYIILGTTGGSQNPANDGAFDHVTMVTMNDGKPTIVNLKMSGILDETGKIPIGGDTLSFEPKR